jgi:hypothetical protein
MATHALKPIGTFHDYQSFVALLRARKAELGLSDLALDDAAGLTGGHSGKLLGPAQVKGIGRQTLTALLDALGLSGTLYADPAKVARIAGQWERRHENYAHTNGHIGRAAIARARPAVLRDLARRAASKRWAGSTPEQRRATVEKLNAARAAKRRARTNAM